MISLDTNVVLRFLLGDIPAQTQKATDLIEKQRVYVTDAVIVEIIYVLEKVISLPRTDVVELVAGFLGFANVLHNPDFLLDAIALYRKRPALSIVDCYASVEAETYGNTLATFDRRLASQRGGHVKAL